MALFDPVDERVAVALEVNEEVAVGGMLHARKLSKPRAVIPLVTALRPTVSVCVPEEGTVYETEIQLVCPDWLSTMLELPSHKVAVIGAPVMTEVARVTDADQALSTGRYVLMRTEKVMTAPAGADQDADIDTAA